MNDTKRPPLTPEQAADALRRARAIVERHARDPNADGPDVLWARTLVSLFPEDAGH